MASLEPPTMYAGSFWSRPYHEGAPKKLLKAQEMSLLKDIKAAVVKRVENRINTARRFAVGVRKFDILNLILNVLLIPGSGQESCQNGRRLCHNVQQSSENVREQEKDCG